MVFAMNLVTVRIYSQRFRLSFMTLFGSQVNCLGIIRVRAITGIYLLLAILIG
jgi:hypothetical protein